MQAGTDTLGYILPTPPRPPRHPQVVGSRRTRFATLVRKGSQPSIIHGGWEMPMRTSYPYLPGSEGYLALMSSLYITRPGSDYVYNGARAVASGQAKKQPAQPLDGPAC